MLRSDEVLQLLLGLGLLLALARVLAEIARRLRQPMVLGEIVAGIVLGPSVLGRCWPRLQSWIYPSSGPVSVSLEAMATLSLASFLLVAGLEVDVRSVWRQHRTTWIVGSIGMAVPFAIGLACAQLVPSATGAQLDPQARPNTTYALFFATALSISALPVIARTLMDLRVYRTDFGMAVIATAMLNDLVGWVVFAALTGDLPHASSTAPPPWASALLAVLFAVLSMTLLRRLFDRLLPWIEERSASHSAPIAFAIVATLFGAAFTQYAGIHAIFGAFLVGVALGDSSHLKARTRATISDSASSLFAPLFFASIGLRVDVVGAFDPWVSTFVLAVATCGKLLGCGLGARLAGMPPREAWGFGFAMNARGSMEIVLGLLALQAGLIGETTFVALLFMALVTTLIAGPALHLILNLRRPRHWIELVPPPAFLPRLHVAGPAQLLDALLDGLTAAGARFDRGLVLRALESRGGLAAFNVGSGVCLPHVRPESLERPWLALATLPTGLELDAPDGDSVTMIVLLLTPAREDALHLELLSQIAQTCLDDATRHAIEGSRDLAELQRRLRTQVDDS